MSANSVDALRNAVTGIDNYKELLKKAPDLSQKEDYTVSTITLDDIMYDDECRRYELAWDLQS